VGAGIIFFTSKGKLVNKINSFLITVVALSAISGLYGYDSGGDPLGLQPGAQERYNVFMQQLREDEKRMGQQIRLSSICGIAGVVSGGGLWYAATQGNPRLKIMGKVGMAIGSGLLMHAWYLKSKQRSFCNEHE
jgi:hypothetical protein